MRFCKGTRVPTKTGVPPMISGSECTIPFRSSDFITSQYIIAISLIRPLTNPFVENGEGLLVQLVDFGGGNGAEFEIRDGGAVIAKGRGEGVVAEITTATGDDYE